MEPVITTQDIDTLEATGAHFWVSISTKNNSADNISSWKVKFAHTQSDWTAEISSDNPGENVETPGLSGVFRVEIFANGPNFQWKQVSAFENCNPDLGCKANCGSMIELQSNASGTSINYSTHWNVVCQDLDLVIPQFVDLD